MGACFGSFATLILGLLKHKWDVSRSKRADSITELSAANKAESEFRKDLLFEMSSLRDDNRQMREHILSLEKSYSELKDKYQDLQRDHIELINKYSKILERVTKLNTTVVSLKKDMQKNN